MENSSINISALLIATVLILVNLSIIILKANGQISSSISSCTPSMMNSFTPCLNYITGSSSGNGNTSPTVDCCNAFKSVMEDGVDCACLIVTGKVPLSLPFINPSLAINLPRACKSSLPLHCKASGVPLPAPGPVQFGPGAAPVSDSPGPVSASPFSPRASKVSANSPPASFETPPSTSPTAFAPITQGRSSRSAVVSSASSRLYISFPPILLMLLVLSILISI